MPTEHDGLVEVGHLARLLHVVLHVREVLALHADADHVQTHRHDVPRRRAVIPRAHLAVGLALPGIRFRLVTWIIYGERKLTFQDLKQKISYEKNEAQ